MDSNIKIATKLSEVDNIISKKDTKIGEGFTATVHTDLYNPEICYKVLKHVPENGFMTHSDRSVFVNSVSVEKKFLEQVYEIAKDIVIPKPLYSLEAENPHDRNGGDSFQVLVMEKLHAYSFNDIMQGKHPFPEKFIREDGRKFIKQFFRKLERFVEKMHDETGIYHRDLHTGNIMIELEEGRPCVIDFGMSTKSSFRSSSDQEIYIELGPGRRKNYKMARDEDFISLNRKKILQFMSSMLRRH